MAIGSRRSLTRIGGRALTATIALVLAGQAGWAPRTSARDLAAAGEAYELPGRGASLVAGHPAAPVVGVAPLVDGELAANDSSVAVEADVAAANGGLAPSIQYEEAEKHADDKIDFAPGGRVTAGFRPRPGDTWRVGGKAPTALPAGRLDGASLRKQGAAARTTDRPEPGARPADRPKSGTPEPSSEPTPAPATPSADPTPAPATTSTDPAAAPIDEPAADGAAVDATNVAWDPATNEATPSSDAAVSAGGLRKEIFGFLPYWQVNSSSLRLDYSKISTIAYFGVGADAAGNLQKRNADGTTTVGWNGWTSSKMTSIISAAHANRTRVVLTIQAFAWNTSGLNRQKALLGSSTARLNLARQIAAAVRDRGADGVNLDFEPLASTYGDEFTALVRTIRTELNRIQAGYQITFDTTGSIGSYPIEAATAAGGADAIFVMGYDYRTAGSSPVGSIAPISRTGYDIRDTIVAYTNRVSPSKIILGVPYYGRAWSTSSSAIQASNTSGTEFGASTSVNYSTAVDYLAQYGRRYDPVEQVAWTAYQRENCTATYGCVTSWRQLYVDDATALSAKYDLVNSYNLRGAGIWALGYDGTRPELWAAIQKKFIGDTTAPTAGIKNLATRQLNPSFTVAWVGKDDVAVASYDVEVSTDGGAWAAWLNATKAVSAVFTGADTHGYAFRVRARDARGNVSAWNVATTSGTVAALAASDFGVIRIDDLSKRAAAATTATKVGTFSAGQLVQILAGPVRADGYDWYRVLGPLTEWNIVNSIGSAVWVAAGGGGQTWLAPAKGPNTTAVAAALGALGYGGDGVASLGTSASAVASRSFSPNGDGSRDRLELAWTNDRTWDSLALKVFTSAGTLVGSVPLSQLAAGPRTAAWDGKVGGTALANGRYLATLVATSGGSTFSNPSPGFTTRTLASHGVTIDRVAPVISSAGIVGTILSPNGDGILDTVKVSLTSTGATGWAFSAVPVTGAAIGTAVRTMAGSGASAAVVWDGRTNGGDVAPDGTYRLTLSALDAAGNRTSRAWTVRLDATPATATVAASPALFSPNGDGAADTTRLTWSASEPISGTARIFRGTTLVRSWSFSASSASAITWTGTTATGAAAADGAYTFRVTGRDAAGNLTVRTAPFVIDRTLSLVRWSPTAFYPQDGDALSPSSRVTFSLKRPAVVTVGIYAGSTLIRTVWTNRSLAAGSHGWTWNGRNAAGALVPRGAYHVRVTATSAYGTAVIGRTVLVDAFRVTKSATTLRAGQTLTLTMTTTETLKAAPTVALTQPGRSAVTRTATALGSGRYRASFTIAAGAGGTATFRITGRDQANGINVSVGSVTIR